MTKSLVKSESSEKNRKSHIQPGFYGFLGRLNQAEYADLKRLFDQKKANLKSC